MIEPLRWLFYSFFQPARFQKDFAQIPLLRRMQMMLRLFLPMFLCTYPLSLLIRLGFFSPFLLICTITISPYLLAISILI